MSDQDDCWLPNKVEVILNYFSNNKDKQVVFSDGFLMDSKGKLLSKTLFECVGLDKEGLRKWKRDRNKIGILAMDNRVTGATVAFLKTAKDYFLPFKEEITTHDYQMALVAADYNILGTIEEKLIKYRVHDNQQRGVWTNQSPATDIIHQRSIYDYVRLYVKDSFNVKR